MDESPGSPGPPPLQDQNGMEVKAPVQRSARPVPAESRAATKAKEKKRVEVTELNPHIVCSLCSGYLIDPVTVVECLHSFCKTCIIKHVDASKLCPTCDTQIHKTKPLLSLRADKALQDIVYKVVPGLYRSEMQNRIKFYSGHPEAEPANTEDAGEVTPDSLVFSPEDEISMSIEYFDNFNKSNDINKNLEEKIDFEKENPNRRFLQCPGSVMVQHLKKFIMTKYGLDQNFLVDVIYKEDLLAEDQTLIDVAYSYNWRKTSPMRFYYRIYQKTKVLTRKRKKKRTKTNSKSHPAKKQRKESTTNLNNDESMQENGMEIDDEDSKKTPKVGATLKGDTKNPAQDKIGDVNKVKEAKKVSPAPVNPLKINMSKVNTETKPVKCVTINQNISYSTQKPDKQPSKSKPLSPILKSSSSDKKARPPPVLVRSSEPAISETKSKPSSLRTANPQSSKKSLTVATSAPSTNKTTLTQIKPASNGSCATGAVQSSRPSLQTALQEKKKPAELLSKESAGPKGSKPVSSAGSVSKTVTTTTTTTAKDKAPINGHNKLGTERKILKTVEPPKSPNKIIPTNHNKGQKDQVEVLEMEVSVSDVKKVLEKKKAEKDAKLMSNGEERLFSNYSIVDQLKKGAAAANLAKQKKQASMMDFTRTSEALNSSPKVPPTIQGLQPKVSGGSELSAIVHSLAQKQQSLNMKIQAATGAPDSKSVDSNNKDSLSVSDGEKTPVSDSGKPKSEATKTLGTMALSTKSGPEKPGTAVAANLPVSTSIKPIAKDCKSGPAATEKNSTKGQQMLNFYKNNFPKTSASPESAKDAETLTKNIPAGTTVTVKTVDVKPAATTKVSAPVSAAPASRVSSAFRPSSNFKSGKTGGGGGGVVNSYPAPPGSASQTGLINPFVQTQMAAAAMAQQHAYLNFSSNPHAQMAAAALTAQMEAVANANYINNTAANLVMAAAAAQITQSPMTTLAFTKPISSSDESRFGLKIPQPVVSRHSSPVSSFGTSRLQVKVNSDGPKSGDKAGPEKTGEALSASPSKLTAKHSMPAILPFNSVKKVQALPKSMNQAGRSLPISSFINKNQNNTSTKSPPLSSTPPKSPLNAVSTGVTTAASSIKTLTDSNPFKSSEPVKKMSPSLETKTSPALSAAFKPVTQQVNSLKKLVADLNSVQQKSKAENLLNTLKKSSENKLLNESKKSFLGMERTDKPKEVTSS